MRTTAPRSGTDAPPRSVRDAGRCPRDDGGLRDGSVIALVAPWCRPPRLGRRERPHSAVPVATQTGIKPTCPSPLGCCVGVIGNPLPTTARRLPLVGDPKGGYDRAGGAGTRGAASPGVARAGERGSGSGAMAGLDRRRHCDAPLSPFHALGRHCGVAPDGPPPGRCPRVAADRRSSCRLEAQAVVLIRRIGPKPPPTNPLTL